LKGSVPAKKDVIKDVIKDIFKDVIKDVIIGTEAQGLKGLRLQASAYWNLGNLRYVHRCDSVVKKSLLMAQRLRLN